MWRRRALLRTDPFTVSAAGRAWIDVHWLFQLAWRRFTARSAFAGSAVAKALVVAAGAVLGTRAAEERAGRSRVTPAPPRLLGLMFLARHLLPLRPIVATLLLRRRVLVPARAPSRARIGRRPPRADRAARCCRRSGSTARGWRPSGPALIAAYLIPGNSSRAVGPRHWSSPARPPVRAPGARAGGCVLASFATPYGLDAVRLPARLLAPHRARRRATCSARPSPRTSRRSCSNETSPEMAAHLARCCWASLGRRCCSFARA